MSGRVLDVHFQTVGDISWVYHNARHNDHSFLRLFGEDVLVGSNRIKLKNIAEKFPKIWESIVFSCPDNVAQLRVYVVH